MASKHKNEWFAPVFGVLTTAAVLILFNLHLLITTVGLWVTPSNANAAGPVVAAADPAYTKTPRIVVPKINVDAPVVYNMQSTSEPDVQNALKAGVLHFGGSALPGYAGNAVFVGHSSNSVWEEGDYKFVFALLDKLGPGDTIYLFYEGKRYAYEVTAEKIVNPYDVSVLNTTATPTITLITCYPVGTAFSRLVITAAQTDPDPQSVTAPKNTGSSKPVQLPGN